MELVILKDLKKNSVKESSLIKMQKEVKELQQFCVLLSYRLEKLQEKNNNKKK